MRGLNTSPLSPELAPAANLLESDQPKVLALVGAGISADATSLPHATWLGLLKHGVNHLVSTEFFPGKRGADLIASLETAFSPFDLVKAIEHAELVERNLMVPNPACFAQWLDSAFATFPIRPGRAAALDALRNLQQAGVLLVTTNYDSLLAEATGLQPVTWQEHDEFLKVVSRQRPGILHLHGYWKRPSSVVLGRTSYDRIVADRDFQDIFKSLWLEWSWIYVGCGDGLDDPNLGRLLAWGQRWGAGALPDYFLAKADKAHALAQRIDKPRNLVIIGYADHADLPGILTSLTPAAHCWPFVPVDGNFFLYRASNSPATLAFPSRAEYLDGRVPTLAADAEVLARLERHGWAFVLDVASVGKTTLGLRIAATPAQRDYPAYYVDLAMVDPEMVMDALTAARSLARPGALLIVDNAHHQPELARQVWEQWRDRSRGSRLLLIATRIQRVAITTPAQDLEFFECHAANPAIELRPAAADLVSILACIHGRVGAGRAAPLAAPPPSVLQEWHRDYGNALGAFCLAVLGRLNEFSRGRWELPLEAASDWVKEKWLKHLNARALENLLCLSVFGSQEFELEVADHALPHPNDTDLLLRLGLVVRRHRGKLSQHRSFRLREPGWGRLILAAHPTDGERILFEAAARYPITALLLSARLRREGSLERLSLLWRHLALNPNDLIRRIELVSLGWASNLVQTAASQGQSSLADRLWTAIERDPDNVAERAWETPLDQVAASLEKAKRQGRNTEPLWTAIERDPNKVAERALETPLNDVAAFLEEAKRQGRDTEPLWTAIERDPNKVAERAWKTPLKDAAAFLEEAKRQGRNTGPLWTAIERDPDKVAERAWETPLNNVAAFLEEAKRQGRNTEPLWTAIERDPDKVAERAWETPLNNVAAFLEEAKRQGRNTEPLWTAIERDPDRVAERAWETPLNDVAAFLEEAKRQGRNTGPLWTAIERDPDKVAERAWETPLDKVAAFLEEAKRQGRDTEPLWTAIERDPNKVAERAWKTPLKDAAAFLEEAKRQMRNTEPLWTAIERNPDKVAERAWETPLKDAAAFLEEAKRQMRNTEPLWTAIERDPDKVAERAWETPLNDVAAFLEEAKRQGRNTEPLWTAIERN
ncbi:MAG: SIR2 family protein, partial [Bryobacteraceae bacterium]